MPPTEKIAKLNTCMKSQMPKNLMNQVYRIDKLGSLVNKLGLPTANAQQFEKRSLSVYKPGLSVDKHDLLVDKPGLLRNLVNQSLYLVYLSINQVCRSINLVFQPNNPSLWNDWSFTLPYK